MDNIRQSYKKEQIAKSAWEYMMNTGLASASIGGFCKETKYGESTLYYYYKNKDDIWISAAKYGISDVVDKLLSFTLNHTNDIRTYFDSLLNEVDKYKYQLRLAIQITTSPSYGDRMRQKAMDFRTWYDEYAKKIIYIFNCTPLQAETFIYSIISYIMDYVIWDDKEKSQMLLENLYMRIMNFIKSDNP